MEIDNYSVSYQNDALHSYMVFKLKQGDKLIDYQIKMLKENPAQSFLPMHKNQFDNEVFIYYDITSKITMEQFFSRRKLNRHEFLTIIKSFIKTLQTGKRYLLQGGAYILDIRYLYINPSSLDIFVAYMPCETSSDVSEELRSFLIDLIVYKVAFLHPEEGSFVYRLLSLLKDEAFSLEQLDRLVYDIAIEYGSGAEDNKKISVKAAASQEGFRAAEGKHAALVQKRQLPKASPNKNMVLIFMLVQFFFAASTLLLVNFIIKKNQGLDVYSLTGILLLVLSMDFLTVKRLGVLKAKMKGASAASANNDKEEISQAKEAKGQKEKRKVLRDIQKYEAAYDMDTSVLIDEPEVYPFLAGCSDNQQERIILNKPSFIIGRLKNQADYISSNSTVGKVHAEIICQDGAYYVRDLNSRNGTYINGERIVSNALHAIKNNDSIAFANSEYKFIWGQGAKLQ